MWRRIGAEDADRRGPWIKWGDWLGLWVNRWASQPFPWVTFLINVTGSFAIGFLTMLLTRWLTHQNFRLLIVTGFLGGYTT